jgi:hypothetical protein
MGHARLVVGGVFSTFLSRLDDLVHFILGSGHFTKYCIVVTTMYLLYCTIVRKIVALGNLINLFALQGMETSSTARKTKHSS